MFIRELISNASDALEKLRHKLVSEGQALPDMEIHLQTDADRGTITIQVPPPMGRETGCLSVTPLGSQWPADHLELNIVPCAVYSRPLMFASYIFPVAHPKVPVLPSAPALSRGSCKSVPYVCDSVTVS